MTRWLEESTTFQAIMRRGRLAEVRRILVLIGQEKLGKLSEPAMAVIYAEDDLDRLEQLCKRLLVGILDGSEDGMNATEAMERIEGQAFSALVNLASDLPTFLRILTSQPEVRTLADEMKSESVTLDVFTRVGELAALPTTEEYEHPADSAVAAYLWLLNAGNGEYSARAMETALECKQCWWVRKMAEHIGGQKRPERRQETLPMHKGS